MTWFKVDDNLADHPKVRRIPRRRRRAVMGLWALIGSYCSRHLTDGHIEPTVVDDLDGQADAGELTRVGLWHTQGHDCADCPQPRYPDGYVFHDWGQANPYRADVETKRAEARQRMARSRGSRSVRANTTGTDSEQHAKFASSSPYPVPYPSRPEPESTSIQDSPSIRHPSNARPA